MSASYRLNFTSFTALCLLAALASAQCPNNDVNCSFCMGSQCAACNGAVLVNGTCSVPINSVNGCVAYGSSTATTTTTTTNANGTTTTTTNNANTSGTTNANGTINGSSNDANGNAYNSTNGVCTACAAGFYVVNNTCLPNPADNCASYTLTGGCTACFANIRALKNQCNGDSNGNSTLGTNVTCGTKHCEICGSNGVCEGCGRGYVMEGTNNTCSVYKAGYYGCLRLSNGVCTACRYGFYYKNGGCTSSELITNSNKRINANSIYVGPNKLNGINNGNNNNGNNSTSGAARGLVGLAFVVLAALF